MSDSENKFIRQLKITLISVLGPFIILTIASLVSDHYQIKNNKIRIEAIQGSTVSYDMLVIYVDEFRRANDLTMTSLKEHKEFDIVEFNRIHSRIDDLIKQMYPHEIRGLKHPDNKL